MVVSQDLKSLTIWGWARDLDKAWEQIHEEYTTLTNDNSFKASFRLTKEVETLNNKLYILDTIIKHLANRYVPALFDQLRVMGFKHPFTKESHQKDLQKVCIQAKSLMLRLKQAKDEIKGLTSKESSTKQDYYGMLSVLSKFKGGDINPKHYTVMQFISDSNLYKKSNGQ